MQMTLFSLALAGVAIAAPAPAPTSKAVLPVEQRQIGGSGGGEVGPISGGFSGIISGGIIAGCIGGEISGKGTTLCATETLNFAHHTPAAKVEDRQIAGSLGGFVGPSISGTLSGEVSPTLTGCIGGVIPFAGQTICLGLPARATAAH